MNEQYMTYKTRPVVRNGKTIYYGSMANEYVVMMNVISDKAENDISVASAIQCYLMKTDKNLNPMQAITQKAERENLYEALELAAAWLTRVKC
ncbi:MAG: hypothetical protein MJ062_02375 [Oscillospiraceae bacterium]|nr:hypothetical protein [Oscillospiraceae bacterium]